MTQPTGPITRSEVRAQRERAQSARESGSVRKTVARGAVGLATAATLVGGAQSARAVTYGPETHALSQQFSGVRTPGGGTVNVQSLGTSPSGPHQAPGSPHKGTTPTRTVARTHPGTNPGRVLPGGKRVPSAVPAPTTHQAPGGPRGTNRGGSPLPPPAPAAKPGGSVLAPGGPIGTNLGSSPLGGGPRGTRLGGNPLPH